MVSLKVFNLVGDELRRIEQSYNVHARLVSLDRKPSRCDRAELNRFFQGYCLRSPQLALACSG